jgi:transposase InsO family protein
MKDAVHYAIRLKDPNCQPISSRERRRSPQEIQTIIDAVKEMEQAGLIEDSISPWSSQFVMVKKKRDGVELAEKRPCVDYRLINEATVGQASALPLTEMIFNHLKGSRLFSKLDLTKGFWQIPLEEKTKEILAISTPLGLKQPRFMPFGIKNAPAAFQKEMQRVLKDKLWKGVIVFVDDILIYSETTREHAELVEWVLKKLKEAGYYAHPDKCEFFRHEVSYLGHIVSEKGVAVQQYKVKAVVEWKEPKTKKEVRAFLGLTGYYRKYIEKYGDLALPLTNLTRQDSVWQWTAKEQKAFDTLKAKLTTAPVLAHPDPQRQYIVTTDASGFAVSGVLSQDQADGTRRPIAYFSRKMHDVQTRYPVHEQELLAIVEATQEWRCYLEGSPHPILYLTDHQSLQWLNTQPNLSGRQARWSEKLSELDFKIQYIPGKENKVADALSRQAEYEPPEGEAKAKDDGKAGSRLSISLANMTSDTPTTVVKVDVPILREAIKQAAQKDPSYKQQLEQKDANDGLVRENGVLMTSEAIVYIPDDRELQRQLIEQVHDTPTGGHLGQRKTVLKMQARCYWPGMKMMIEDYVRGCTVCASTKTSQQKPAGTLRPLPIPHRPWEVISIDFVGPLPKTPDYYDTILVVVDKFSKYAYFIPTTKNVTAQGTARLLIDNVIKQRGLPEGGIISDRDPRFTAALWQEVWKLLQTPLRMSTSYHPQSDGQTERVNKTMEVGLRAHANKTKTNWKDNLALVEAQYNSAVHESTGKTPFEMNGQVWTDAMSLALRSPAMSELTTQGARDLIEGMRATWEDARQRMLIARERQRMYADKGRREERYTVGDRVMLSTKNLAKHQGKLSDPYVGPFTVKEVCDNGVNVKLDLPHEYSKLHPTFHVDKLKRYRPSSIEWPGRVQKDRPQPVLVDGDHEEWEVERLIGKREEQVDVVVSEVGDEEEEEEEEEVKQAGGDVRRSARLRGRTPQTERKRPPRPRRPKTEKRTVIKYLVKWKGYEEDEATWQSVNDLQNAQDLIDEYEYGQLAERGENSVGLQSVCTPVCNDGGVTQLQMVIVK